MAEIEPIVGGWYQDMVQECLFEVVAAEQETVEIQYFDGSVEALDRGTWNEMELEVVEPPEDWSGPFDELSADDMGYSDRAMHPEDWGGPLARLEGVQPDLET